MLKKTLLLGILVSIWSLPLAAIGQSQVSDEAGVAVERIQELRELRRQIIELITQLKVQLERLRAERVLFRQTARDISETARETREIGRALRDELRLTRRLARGMSGEDVKLLQELLATDPEIYPEGYQTGFFGNLTHLALLKFQRKAGLPLTGEADDQTIAKVNEILEHGVPGQGRGLIEVDGKRIPPGLLRAHGIQRLLGGATTTDDADGENEEEEENGEEEENEEEEDNGGDEN